MKIFLSQDNIRPGNEWFRRRNQPLTPEMAKADYEALHRAIDHSYGDGRHTAVDKMSYLRNWVGKVVQSHVEL